MYHQLWLTGVPFSKERTPNDFFFLYRNYNTIRYAALDKLKRTSLLNSHQRLGEGFRNFSMTGIAAGRARRNQIPTENAVRRADKNSQWCPFGKSPIG